MTSKETSEWLNTAPVGEVLSLHTAIKMGASVLDALKEGRISIKTRDGSLVYPGDNLTGCDIVRLS